MKYTLLFTILLLFLISCEKEPEIPTGQGNKIELSVSTDYTWRVDTTAVAQGSILNLGYLGEVIQHGHCWSITPQPDTTYFRTKLGYSNEKETFMSTLHGLNINTNYYVRAYVVNQTHVAYGEQFVIRAVCGGETEISYEGQSYQITSIGSQCWMRKNLNAGSMINTTDTGYPHSEMQNDGTIEKYCYNNEINNCNTYGGLYDWDELMQYTQTEGAKGICPTGWHVPTNAEWEQLVLYLGGNYVAGVRLKSSAVNEFKALLSGYRLSTGEFIENSFGARFWSSTQNMENLPFYRYVTNDYDGVMNTTYNKSGAFHVRCIKNN